MLRDRLRNNGVTPNDFETLLVLSKSATSGELRESPSARASAAGFTFIVQQLGVRYPPARNLWMLSHRDCAKNRLWTAPSPSRLRKRDGRHLALRSARQQEQA